MIHSLLDTDLYKFTMMQLVFHHYPKVSAGYRFIVRKHHFDIHAHVDAIAEAIDAFCELRFQPDELDYLASLPYFKSDFIDYLRHYQPNRSHIQIKHRGEFALEITGPWLDTILFEVPLLALISEVFFANQFPDYSLSQGEDLLEAKIQRLQTALGPSDSFNFTDFGTRRRFSCAWQRHVVQRFSDAVPQWFTGTSNVLLAKELGLTPVGTMGHEYIQAFQVLAPDLRQSQVYALMLWLDEYGEELGIALSDTYNEDVFLSDFQKTLADAYRGARQDSGDPYVWGERLLEHYRSLGISPADKTLVFSDSLTIDKALSLYQRFHRRTNTMFGIGTHLTHHLGLQPLDMVIKIVYCEGKPVAKISDNPVKSICPDGMYLAYLKSVFNIIDLGN